MTLILDTSVVLAALDTADPDHARCAALIAATAPHESLLVASTVLVELAYWVHRRLGQAAWSTFVEDLTAGAYEYELVSLPDVRRADEIDRAYAALELGLVDASLVAIAERLGERRIATLNERDFRPIVPAHCGYLVLLPSDA